jgi:hypothetical protein
MKVEKEKEENGSVLSECECGMFGIASRTNSRIVLHTNNNQHLDDNTSLAINISNEINFW